MITVMAVIFFCLFFVGALSAQEYDKKFSGFSVERTVAPTSAPFHMDANRGGTGIMSAKDSLEDLENAYYYQMIEQQYINDDLMEVTAPLKNQIEPNRNHPSCKC